MIDFTPLDRGEKTLMDIASSLTLADLHNLTDEMTDTILNLISGATDSDVVFQPEDPAAHDRNVKNPQEVNLPWTLGHVIVHLTATAEEYAAQATNLARGVEIRGRSRYETPWRSIQTIVQVRSRLEESRHMIHALVNAWPDQPHLDLFYTPSRPGARPRNAMGYFVAGLAHSDVHLEQIKEILRQSRAASSLRIS